MKAQLSRDAIDEMLEDLATAVSSGDLAGVSKHYVFPVLMISDGDAMLLNKPPDLEAMFATGREWYISQGILSTHAELQEIEELTELTAAANVRWPGFDSTGRENYSERSYYIIQNVEGVPRIRVAMTRTK